MSAQALAVTFVASQVVEMLSAASAELPNAGLGPILDRATDVLQGALKRLEKLVCNGHALPDPVATLRAASAKRTSKPKTAPKPSGRLSKKQTERELESVSDWDPDTVLDQIEVSRCRALLLEVIRRAAHDWVLYRHHARLKLRQIANDAYVWLFEEKPGHPWWEIRKAENRMITAFLVICDELDLEPSVVRKRVREMTVKDITSAGRPAERRHRRDKADDVHYADHSVSVDFDVVGAGDSAVRSSYENAFAVSTPTYL